MAYSKDVERGRLSAYPPKGLLKEFQALSKLERRSGAQMIEKLMADFVEANRHRLPKSEKRD